MKKHLSVLKIVSVAALLFCSSSVNAQGFLKKLSKGLDKVEKTTNKVLDASDKVLGTTSNSLTDGNTTANPESDSTTVDWSKVKFYSAKAVYEVDD